MANIEDNPGEMLTLQQKVTDAVLAEIAVIDLKVQRDLALRPPASSDGACKLEM